MGTLTNKFKIAITIVIIVALVGCLSAYATYNYLASEVVYIRDGKKISVEQALNELYNRNSNTIVNMEYIWNSSNQNIDYTYNVDTAGIYLVAILNSNNDGIKGKIETNSEIILEKELKLSENYTRYMTLKLLKAEINENINIKGYNGGNGANAFIYKINNSNISYIVESDMAIDGTAQVSYTANTDNEKVMVLGFSCGKNRTGNIIYDGIYLSQERKNNDIYLGYVVLNKDSRVTISSYGYDWGAGVAIILK